MFKKQPSLLRRLKKKEIVFWLETGRSEIACAYSKRLSFIESATRAQCPHSLDQLDGYLYTVHEGQHAGNSDINNPSPNLRSLSSRRGLPQQQAPPYPWDQRGKKSARVLAEFRSSGGGFKSGERHGRVHDGGRCSGEGTQPRIPAAAAGKDGADSLSACGWLLPGQMAEAR